MIRPSFIWVCGSCAHNYRQEPPIQNRCMGCGSYVEKWVPEKVQKPVFIPEPIVQEDAPIEDTTTARFADMDFGPSKLVTFETEALIEEIKRREEKG